MQLAEKAYFTRGKSKSLRGACEPRCRGARSRTNSIPPPPQVMQGAAPATPSSLAEVTHGAEDAASPSAPGSWAWWGCSGASPRRHSKPSGLTLACMTQAARRSVAFRPPPPPQMKTQQQQQQQQQPPVVQPCHHAAEPTAPEVVAPELVEGPSLTVAQRVIREVSRAELVPPVAPLAGCVRRPPRPRRSVRSSSSHRIVSAAAQPLTAAEYRALLEQVVAAVHDGTAATLPSRTLRRFLSYHAAVGGNTTSSLALAGLYAEARCCLALLSLFFTAAHAHTHRIRAIVEAEPAADFPIESTDASGEEDGVKA